jgi:hypothetical protein
MNARSALAACALLAAALLPAPARAAGNDSVLASALRPYVRVLSRPVTVYHWADRGWAGLGTSGPVDPRTPAVRSYVEWKTKGFWDINTAFMGVAGNGLYAAVDPISSYGYGGDNWSLFRLRVRKGTRFLYNFDDLNVPLSPAVVAELKSRNCSPSGVSLGGWLHGHSKECRKAFMGALRALGVQALVYPFMALPVGQCKDRPQVAFNFISDQGFDFTQTYGLVNDIPAEDPARAARAEIRSFFSLGTYTGETELWPGVEKDPAAFNHALMEETFGCGKHDEDYSPNNLLFMRRRLDKIASVAKEVSQAIGKPINPYRFRVVAAGRRRPGPGWEKWWSTARHLVDAAALQGKDLTVKQLLEWHRRAELGGPGQSGKLRTLPAASLYAEPDLEHMGTSLFFRMYSAYYPGSLKIEAVPCADQVPEPFPLPGANPLCQEIWKHAQAGSGGSAGIDWAATLADMQAGRLRGKWYAPFCWPRLPNPDPMGLIDDSLPFCSVASHLPPPGLVPVLKDIVAAVNTFFHQVSGAIPAPDNPNTWMMWPPEPAQPGTETKPLSSYVHLVGSILDLASYVETQLRMIRPFTAGTDEVAHWVTDYILQRSGLPPPLLIESPEPQLVKWAYELKAETGEALRLMEACLKQYVTKPFEELQKTDCALIPEPSAAP